MGRKRTVNPHLPAYLYLKGRAHWFRDRHGEWHNFGRDYPSALRKMAAIMDRDATSNTVQQLIGRYSLEELANKAAKTARGRAQQFKNIAKVFGDMPPESIEPHHVWNYFTKRGRTEQARHEIRAMSVLLTFARRIGARTSSNPCFGLQLPQSKSRSRYVTLDEFYALRALAPPMIQYAMDLALIGGMDQATIRKLERRHATDEGIAFERGKTQAAQLIEWNDELRAAWKGALALAPQVRQAIICNRRGKAYSANGFQSQWQRVMRKAKEKKVAVFHFHDLRAKSASDADSDQEAADRLGHADAAITRKVYRRKPRRARALSIPKERTDGSK